MLRSDLDDRRPDAEDGVPSDGADPTVLTPSADPGEGAAPGAPTRRRRRRLLLGIVAGVVALVVGGAFWVAHLLNSTVTWIGDPFAGLESRPPTAAAVPAAAAGAAAPGGADPAAPATAAAPTTFLVVGSDSRVSGGDPTRWVMGGQRTDTIMLVHLPADRQAAFVVSIPRDSWVPVPGHGTAKINAAYSWGGAPLLIRTVEQLTGVRVDHLAIADFDSFVRLTDSLGGVEIDVAEGARTRSGVLMAPGPQVLTGTQALDYVRERASLPGGDLDRIQRQQAWMRAIGKQALDADTLSNPAEVLGLLKAVEGSVGLDDGLGTSQLLELAGQTRHLRADDVRFLTVPVAGLGWSPDGKQSIVRLDTAGSKGLMSAMAADQMAPYVEAHAAELRALGTVAR